MGNRHVGIDVGRETFIRDKDVVSPGPASTVEERSLRNISSEGTAVRSPPKEASFQTR